MFKQDIQDGWSVDGQTFIHYGMGYRLKKDLTQVCIGPVDQDGEPVKAPTTPPALIEQGDSVLQNSPRVLVDMPLSFAPSKHAGGRPRKAGDVSRWTIQRRNKELQQGALI